MKDQTLEQYVKSFRTIKDGLATIKSPNSRGEHSKHGMAESQYYRDIGRGAFIDEAGRVCIPTDKIVKP